MAGPVIDAHHHFWDPARADYPWLTDELAAIRQPFGPDDLKPILAEAGVDRTILVQTISSVEETQEFLATTIANEFIAGVVGWVDLTDPAIEDVIAGLLAAPGGSRLVGIRHQVHDEPDPAWLLRPDVDRGISAVGRAGLAYDLLVRPRELPAAVACVRAHPEIAFVIDHLAKPPIRSGGLEPWLSGIRPFGELGNVAAKVSGLVTEADWQSWQLGDIQPYFDEAVRIFSPDRTLFGSDWPVCLLAAPYDVVVETARSLTTGFTEDERDLFFGGTARRIYGLDQAG
jgi:L-fuconolactonase